MKTSEREQLRAFWRGHLEGWRQSDLNQREYCEAHGLSLKRFGNWRAEPRHEDTVPERKLLWRRDSKPGHRASHMTSPMTKAAAAPPAEAAALPLLAAPTGARRHFSEEAKRQIVEEASRPGASVSGGARRYGIAVRVLFRWKQALGLGASQGEPALLPVRIMDGTEASAGQPTADLQPVPAPPSLIIERAPGIEIELLGGRRGLALS